MQFEGYRLVRVVWLVLSHTSYGLSNLIALSEFTGFLFSIVNIGEVNILSCANVINF